MCIRRYETPEKFIDAIHNRNGLISGAYSRVYPDGHIATGVRIRSQLLSSIPILGTIRGLARLYSIWSVKDRSDDSTLKLIKHTIIGVLETLGLGIIHFALCIVLTVLAILSGMLCNFVLQCCSPTRMKFNY
ncbi:hypothetical protein [Chlamydia felis Fe/C-56]|uniref:Uncharacterized protein n=1 Tax=Chlamydia felis (strain Fe/C-56) TaxID=264202 RepID=Q254U3_CHLFF|nr:hypothetical protein [Chlamydia felis]BAE81195.1 hypothetical protein [Chlamydia felis Fe/C-56]